LGNSKSKEQKPGKKGSEKDGDFVQSSVDMLPIRKRRVGKIPCFGEGGHWVKRREELLCLVSHDKA